MNRNLENLNINDNSHSPIIIRSNNINNSLIKNSAGSINNYEYSPFIFKDDSNSRISNSNNKSQTISTNLYKYYTPSPNTCKQRLSDRFIPMNKGTNLLEKFELAKKWDNQPDLKKLNSITETNTNNYSTLLENNFFGQENMNKANLNTNIKTKIFEYKTDQKKKSNSLKLNYLFEGCNESLNCERKINTKPYKILDAPGLIDDFYLNLVDWSSRNDIAVGLNNTAYLWCTNKTQVVQLLEYEGDKYVSSIMWNNNGTEVAIGNSNGLVELWDVQKKKIIRILEGHSSRVSVIAWNPTSNIISSGSKDYSIINRDFRCSNDSISKLISHKQEVCGLKWSYDGTQLASGGNDNKLMVWNLHYTQPLMKSSNHTAAVKAIAWSPHQSNLLASGGGTADRCIRFWNTSSFIQTNFVDTGSQVCNLVFSKSSNELVSTHGYSLNQINVWKLPNMYKLATLTGHTYRVLYLGISPDGQNIVTGAGDETLRFWNIFPPLKTSNDMSSLFPSNMDVR